MQKQTVKEASLAERLLTVCWMGADSPPRNALKELLTTCWRYKEVKRTNVTPTAESHIVLRQVTADDRLLWRRPCLLPTLEALEPLEDAALPSALGPMKTPAIVERVSSPPVSQRKAMSALVWWFICVFVRPVRGPSALWVDTKVQCTCFVLQHWRRNLVWTSTQEDINRDSAGFEWSLLWHSWKVKDSLQSVHSLDFFLAWFAGNGLELEINEQLITWILKSKSLRFPKVFDWFEVLSRVASLRSECQHQ